MLHNNTNSVDQKASPVVDQEKPKAPVIATAVTLQVKTFATELKEKIGSDIAPGFIEILEKNLPKDYFSLSKDARFFLVNALRKDEEFFAVLLRNKESAAKFLKVSVENDADLIKKLNENRLGQKILMTLSEIANRFLPNDFVAQLKPFFTDNYYNLDKYNRSLQLRDLCGNNDFLKVLRKSPIAAGIFLTSSAEGDAVLLGILRETPLKVYFMNPGQRAAVQNKAVNLMLLIGLHKALRDAKHHQPHHHDSDAAPYSPAHAMK
jgi:hypothetical protein